MTSPFLESVRTTAERAAAEAVHAGTCYAPGNCEFGPDGKDVDLANAAVVAVLAVVGEALGQPEIEYQWRTINGAGSLSFPVTYIRHATHQRIVWRGPWVSVEGAATE